MFKSFAVFVTLCLVVSVSAGLIETHHVVHEPVLAKVGAVVHSAPSAVSHQSITRVHNTAVVQPVVAPVVKTTIHAAPAVVPVVKTVQPVVPVVKTVVAPAVVPVAKTVHPVVPVVKTVVAPAVVPVHTYAAAPVVHSVPVVHAAPVVKTIVPAAYVLHH